MRRLALLISLLGFLSSCAHTKTGAGTGRPDEPPEPVIVTCEARTPAASWRRSLTFVGAVTDEREPDRVEWDLLELAGRLGLTSCPPAAAGSTPRSEVVDAVLAGDPLTRDTYVRFLLEPEPGISIPVALIVAGFVQDPVMDSRIAASTVASLLIELDGVSSTTLVPSGKAAELMAEMEAQAAVEAAALAPVQGMTPEEQDAFAAELFCRRWSEQDASMSYADKHGAIWDLEPVLKHTDWPGVLAMAAPDVRIEIARKVAARHGLTELCEPFHRDLEAWIATQDVGE